MPSPIPKEWRDCVIQILQTNDHNLIGWTTPARQRWEFERFGADIYEAYDAMVETLIANQVEGNETTSMPGQLATYEFLFQHRDKRMYGKIALIANRRRILILSAHPAQRDSLSP